MKKAINIRLEKEMLSALDKYAKELERPRTFLIEKAISAYFDKLDEMIADNRIDEIKSGRVKPIPLREVLKNAGINV
ncbi:MAG: ribbon-helix-helix domain-containing protein [Candidatus Cloacimonetes bacterium]|nr:ribbon-helix-helix domain-containing protein [Candidatus Cloacimonadota bacterium]